ncbi:MAG: protein kinase [Planctomycetes bacterium]|nr:protein kinase [Planctomycetota bacterium]
MSDSDPVPEEADLDSVFARCLERIDDEGDGALELVCREHPEFADELRARLGRLRAAGIVSRGASRPERIDRYRILDVLGEGGMGTVYLAEQREPVRRRVALKVIKLGMDSRQVMARFEAERQALAMMNHDNIARVFDAGTTDTGQPFFVMEHVAGLPITEHCDMHQLGTKERLELFQQVCSGVQHAHQKGVIHRDLKPGNVLVSVEQGRAVPKIIDFGLARATDHGLVAATIFTELGQIIGTPEYMSPEQAEMTTQDIDTRTDVYSLGVMLYELLVGELPFTRRELREAGLLEIRRKIREDVPPKPSTRLSSLGEASTTVARKRNTSAGALARELEGDLDWVVMMALDKDRNRRYASATELAGDIGKYLSQQPVDARPPTVAYRMRKFCSKYRSQVTAFAVVLLTLVAGIVGTWRSLIRERQQRGIAQRMSSEAERRATEAVEAVRRERRGAYLAGLFSAQAAIQLDDVRAARERLDETPPEHRAWEWRYAYASLDESLWRLPNRLMAGLDPLGERLLVIDGSREAEIRWLDGRDVPVRLIGHSAAVTDAAFSADGARAITGSLDDTARIWDVRTGDPVAVCRGHEAAVVDAEFDAAGRRVVTCSFDGTIRIWDASDGSELVCITCEDASIEEPGPPDRERTLGDIASQGRAFRRLAVDRTGERLIVVSAAARVRLFDLTTRELLREIDARDAEFDAEGRRFVTRGDSVTVWNARSGARLLDLDERSAYRARFDSSGARIATVSQDGLTTLWSADSGDRLRVLPTRNARDVRPAPDGRYLIVIGAWSRVAEVWDTRTASLVRKLRHDAVVLGTTISADGSRILTQCESFASDGSRGLERFSIYAWDAADHDGSRDVARHTADIRSVELGSDGRTIVTATEHGVCLWDAVSGRQVSVLVTADEQEARRAVLSPGLRWVAAELGNSVSILNADTGVVERRLGGYGGLRAASFAVDGQHILLSRGDKIVMLETRGWTPVREFHVDGEVADGVVFLVDRPLALSWHVERPRDPRQLPSDLVMDSDVSLWSVETGEVLATLEHSSWLLGLDPVVGHRGGLVATMDRSDVILWDDTGQRVRRLAGDGSPILQAAFSADDSLLLTVSVAGTVRIWDIETGTESCVLPDVGLGVSCGDFHPDGRRCATVSRDGVVHVHDVRTGRELLSLRGESGGLPVVHFGPEGDRLLTAAGRDLSLWSAIARSTRDEVERAERGADDEARAILADAVRRWGSLELAATAIRGGEEAAAGMQRAVLRLVRRETARQREEARRIIEGLVATLVARSDVYAAVRGMSNLAPFVQRCALEMALDTPTDLEVAREYWRRFVALRAPNESLEARVREFVDRRPGQWYSWLLGAAIRYRRANYDEALVSLDRALELGAERAATLLLRAMAEKQLGRDGQASRTVSEIGGVAGCWFAIDELAVEASEVLGLQVSELIRSDEGVALGTRTDTRRASPRDWRSDPRAFFERMIVSTATGGLVGVAVTMGFPTPTEAPDGKAMDLELSLRFARGGSGPAAMPIDYIRALVFNCQSQSECWKLRDLRLRDHAIRDGGSASRMVPGGATDIPRFVVENLVFARRDPEPPIPGIYIALPDSRDVLDHFWEVWMRVACGAEPDPAVRDAASSEQAAVATGSCATLRLLSLELSVPADGGLPSLAIEVAVEGSNWREFPQAVESALAAEDVQGWFASVRSDSEPVEFPDATGGCHRLTLRPVLSAPTKGR